MDLLQGYLRAKSHLAVLSFLVAQRGIRVDWDEGTGRAPIVFPSAQPG